MILEVACIGVVISRLVKSSVMIKFSREHLKEATGEFDTLQFVYAYTRRISPTMHPFRMLAARGCEQHPLNVGIVYVYFFHFKLPPHSWLSLSMSADDNAASQIRCRRISFLSFFA